LWRETAATVCSRDLADLFIEKAEMIGARLLYAISRPDMLISLPASTLHRVAAAEHEDLLLLVTVSEQVAIGQ
jgi:hypothetical protein